MRMEDGNTPPDVHVWPSSKIDSLKKSALNQDQTRSHEMYSKTGSTLFIEPQNPGLFSEISSLNPAKWLEMKGYTSNKAQDQTRILFNTVFYTTQ